jgi:hypothetical protein
MPVRPNAGRHVADALRRCEVRIADGQHILAHHRRSYDKGAQIEDAALASTLMRRVTSTAPITQ